jgi:ABC-type branched-subunit amino acid transport system substrate-binding protein
MKVHRRWLSWLMVLALVIAACGGDESGGEAEETTTTTAAPATTAGDGDGGTTDTTGPEPMEIATDVGVDLEAGTITIGLLSDLSGGFAALVTPIVSGHQIYWDEVNANGGINGLMVELEVRDTGYVVDTHVQLYAELKDQVVAFGHSTGSPHTVAIAPDLQADGILAIPLTWYSGWTDPAINSNLIPHGSPYCVEAQNVIEWLKIQNPDIGTMAIIGLPGDYGLDAAAGAKLAAEALGIEVVVDLAGQVIPDEASMSAAAAAIAEASPDLVYFTLIPAMTQAVFGLALAGGYQGLWAGTAPGFSPGFIAPDSPIKDAVASSMYFGLYFEGWSGSSPGTEAAKEAVLAAPETFPFDYFLEGFLEAQILHRALLDAYNNGDLTQAGVLAAAKAIEELDFDGLAPTEVYSGDLNGQLQRKTWIMQPDPEGLAAGSTGGSKIAEPEFVGDLVANFDFTGACYSLGG